MGTDFGQDGISVSRIRRRFRLAPDPVQDGEPAEVASEFASKSPFFWAGVRSPGSIFFADAQKPPATIWASACPGPSPSRQTTDYKAGSAWHPSCIFRLLDVEDHASRLPGQLALCPGRQALRSLGGGTAAMLANGGFDTTFPHGNRRSERSGFRGRRRSGPAGGNAKGRSSPAGWLTSHTSPAAQGVRHTGRPEWLCYG